VAGLVVGKAAHKIVEPMAMLVAAQIKALRL
jgi:hypothetical protein